jgi:hypothetical protein
MSEPPHAFVWAMHTGFAERLPREDESDVVNSPILPVR